jgi:hypothetical protein
MLNLTDLSFADEIATLRYDVRHNVADLPTTTEFPLTLRVDTRTGAVTGALTLDGLEEPGLDEAVSKLATWCERTGAALRATRRLPESALPLFERTRFDEAALLPWQRVLYQQMLADLRGMPEENFSAYFKALKADHHPLVLLGDVLDSARAKVERERAVD